MVFRSSAGDSVTERHKWKSMGDKELMWALKNGDLDEVKTLLKKVKSSASAAWLMLIITNFI